MQLKVYILIFKHIMGLKVKFNAQFREFIAFYQLTLKNKRLLIIKNVQSLSYITLF